MRLKNISMKVNISESNNYKNVSGKEKSINCKGCGKNLGILFITDKVSQLIKRKFVCPCGDSSFVIKTENVCMIIPNEELCIQSFKVDDGVNIAVMKEIKNGN